MRIYSSEQQWKAYVISVHTQATSPICLSAFPCAPESLFLRNYALGWLTFYQKRAHIRLHLVRRGTKKSRLRSNPGDKGLWPYLHLHALLAQLVGRWRVNRVRICSRGQINPPAGGFGTSLAPQIRTLYSLLEPKTRFRAG